MNITPYKTKPYSDRKIKIAGNLKDLEAQGYSFGTGFASLIEQHY
ncbi:MAG: hypothetical protein V7K53_00090 [Nostoc sp.]